MLVANSTMDTYISTTDCGSTHGHFGTVKGSCGSSEPSSSTDCNTQKCDWCAGQTCNGHGTCADGKCACNTGYKGLTCDTEASCAGTKAANGVCCAAPGVLDGNGVCCRHMSR